MPIYPHTKSDRLVSVEKTCTKGKRVAADNPLTPEERRVYVLHGPAAATVFIKNIRNISLAEAFSLLNAARKYPPHSHRKGT